MTSKQELLERAIKLYGAELKEAIRSRLEKHPDEHDLAVVILLDGPDQRLGEVITRSSAVAFLRGAHWTDLAELLERQAPTRKGGVYLVLSATGRLVLCPIIWSSNVCS